ncbi:MAG TPA: nucleoside diphosphate kinase regulator [Syntrophales bacterium]|jgi:regulator of nucleoside diphosphate kinase|nr:nucleoside diphosphate kinase regulator [Syntrophales bacterium]
MKMPKKIYITEKDIDRLNSILMNIKDSPVVRKLQDELDRATILNPEEIPPDVVTMNSRVQFKTLETDSTSEITIVYPSDADSSQARVSILAPVGAALIGLRVGDEIEWVLPTGLVRTFQILSVGD